MLANRMTTGPEASEASLTSSSTYVKIEFLDGLPSPAEFLAVHVHKPPVHSECTLVWPQQAFESNVKSKDNSPGPEDPSETQLCTENEEKFLQRSMHITDFPIVLSVAGKYGVNIPETVASCFKTQQGCQGTLTSYKTPSSRSLGTPSDYDRQKCSPLRVKLTVCL
jgi:hypothetical protein